MPAKQDLATPKVPRGLRGIASPSSANELTSVDTLQQEAAMIERWWSQPRWKHTKRVYSGT
jgi:hypothetical protein